MDGSHIRPDSFSVARIQSSDTADLLERLALTDLLEAGALNVISLSAVRDRLGERWERKKADVWAYVERCMARYLAPQDVYRRLDDTDFLVAILSDSGVAAQSLSLHILEDALVHLLGGCTPADMILRKVTGVRDGAIETFEVDVRSVTRAPGGYVAAAAGRADAPPPRPQSMPVVHLVSSSGRELRISHVPEQIVSLRHNQVAGVRPEPSVVDSATGERIRRSAFGLLADSDLAKMDQTTMDVGLIAAAQVQSDRPGIVLPLSFQTLNSARARANLLGVIAPDEFRRRFLIEITNIDPGTPNGRLVEVVSLLQAHTTGVLARVPPHKAALAPLIGGRLMGVVLDLTDSDPAETALTSLMSAFTARAMGLAPSLHVLGLPSRSLFEAAHKAGMTHASARRTAAASLAA